MKRFVFLTMLLGLLLCGCGDDTQPSSTTVPQSSSAPTEATEPPTFAYSLGADTLDENTEEKFSYYRIAQADYYGFCRMGEGLLLFSGENETTLTYVTGDNLPVSTVLKDVYITPEEPSVCALDTGLIYYDVASHKLVTLDLQLMPVSKMELAQEVPGEAALSADGKLLYYYTADALRCLDLRSGISRLLKESNSASQRVAAIHFDGALLECHVLEGEIRKTLLVSSETGETLFSTELPIALYTEGQSFMAHWQENDSPLRLYGTLEEEACRFEPLWDGVWRHYPEMGISLTWRDTGDGVELAWYDLTQSGHLATVRLNAVGAPLDLTVDRKTGQIWMMSRMRGTGEYRLLCWNPGVRAADTQSETLFPYFTAEFPDHQGLERCQETIDALEKQYGLELKIWEDAVKTVPDGYQMVPEHSVEMYDSYLPLLEKAISAYPQEIYQKLSRKSNNNKLTICLVREIYGSDELGSLKKEQGAYFIKNGNSYLVLSLNETIEVSYYHELFHAMDSYIIMEAKTYDEWNSLNPQGFSYDNSYLKNESRDPGSYLDEANRAFIDVYSMSYPKEDRARIMEYAIQEGNEGYFTSEIMSKKLETLCNGIRKAFKLKDDERIFRWEQYLQ